MGTTMPFSILLPSSQTLSLTDLTGRPAEAFGLKILLFLLFFSPPFQLGRKPGFIVSLAVRSPCVGSQYVCSHGDGGRTALWAVNSVVWAFCESLSRGPEEDIRGHLTSVPSSYNRAAFSPKDKQGGLQGLDQAGKHSPSGTLGKDAGGQEELLWSVSQELTPTPTRSKGCDVSSFPPLPSSSKTSPKLTLENYIVDWGLESHMKNWNLSSLLLSASIAKKINK